MPERTPRNDQKRRVATGTAEAKEPMLIDVLVREPQCDSPTYSWDHERNGLRLAGVYHAKRALPADLATFRAEGQVELPVLLLHSLGIPPETYAHARLLGALSSRQPLQNEQTPPAGGWVFIAAAEIDASLSQYPSIETLPPAQLEALKAYIQGQTQHEQGRQPGEVAVRDAEAAAHMIRETRLYLKRAQRARSRGKAWIGREEEEKPVAWRAIEGLSQALRFQLQRDALLGQSEDVPHAQAEQLIRFVPQRFQHALAKLLLDDERLLAFVERPLLRHRAGLLGMQSWRANEGLFLLTDRQALWLRDFFTPGSTLSEGGYIGHMAPLERLCGVALLPAGSAPDGFAERLEPQDSPYQRLVMEVASATGSECFVVEFPQKPEVEKALTRISEMLQAFFPYADGTYDRRVRRLPLVEAWTPRGFEAERLAGLGGIVPRPLAQRLEQRLAGLEKAPGEEILASALVPALEDYKSPARLIALTCRELLVIEDVGQKAGRLAVKQGGQAETVHRYDLSSISSAQLRYSLLGSSLSIFVPQTDGSTRQHVLPFHSPAIAWFLPLFTRLRLLLGNPYRTR